ncbi:MAG TPA: hypothetical protein VLH08_19775 [Acidobacteriota bacterium]|nr:hypothetical protein [Acidobacteriota bacterium]
MQTHAGPGLSKLHRVLNAISLIVISIFIFGVVASTFSEVASAQSTREEEIKQQQAEKAKALKVYTPNKAERLLIRIQNLSFFGGQPRGFYPMVGSAFPGGGAAFGGGYRTLIGDDGYWDIHGLYSISNYRMGDTTFKLPDFANGAMKTHVNAHYAHADKVRFYGIGNNTQPEDLTRFTYKPLTISVTERVELSDWFAVGGGVDFMKLEDDAGEGPNDPSIEERFNPITAPGLFQDLEYIKPRAFAEIDWRQAPGYTTSGGFYRADWSRYSERDELPFDFDRLDIEVDQFVPILRANWVLAFRGMVSTTNVDDGNEIPYYLLPRLGGGKYLRGFPDYRFMDRHSLLLTAEYRWTPSKFLDMAIFYETGKVASRRSDLDLEDLHDCWGIGARFHGPVNTPLRIEFARSVEGNRIIFSAGPSF